MNLRSEFLRKSGTALLLRLLIMAGNYLFILVVARKLGPEFLGHFTLSNTLLQVFGILAVLGMDEWLTRRMTSGPAGRSPSLLYFKLLRYSIPLAFAVALTSGLSAEWLASGLFRKPELKIPFTIMAWCVLPWGMMLLHSAAFRGRRNMTGFLAFRASIGFVSTLIFLLLNAASSKDIMIAFASAVTMASLAAIISWLISMNRQPFGEAIPVPGNFISIAGESIHFMLTGSVFFVMGWFDNLVLGYYTTAENVGIYDIAYKLAAGTTIILMSVNAIQGPVFARLHAQENNAALASALRHSNRLVLSLSLPVLIALALLPEFFLSLFGDEFKVGQLTLLILLAGQIINTLTGSVGILLQMTGEQKLYNRIITGSAMIGILLLILLVPTMNTVGAALASAITNVLQNILTVYWVKRKTGINPFAYLIPG